MKTTWRWAVYIGLSLVALLLFVPMIWMIIGAFAPVSELQRAVPLSGMFEALGPDVFFSIDGMRSWFQGYITLDNFSEPVGKQGLFDVTVITLAEFCNAPVHRWLFSILPDFGDGQQIIRGGRLLLWFENTFVSAFLVMLLSVYFSAAAGYAFAKFNFPGRRPMFWLLIGTIMIPGQVTIIPLFLLVTRGLGWHDSIWAIVLPQVAAPVGIFLMRQYIMGLPTALEEAARIDGCSEPGIFLRVVLPLCKPVLAVWAIFTFIGAWKAFLWPLVITNDQNLYLLEVGLKTLQFTAGNNNVGVLMAAAFLASIPMVAMFFAFQGHLTKGLVVGGVKG